MRGGKTVSTRVAGPFQKVRRLRFQPGLPLGTETCDRTSQADFTPQSVRQQLEAEIEQDRLIPSPFPPNGMQRHPNIKRGSSYFQVQHRRLGPFVTRRSTAFHQGKHQFAGHEYPEGFQHLAQARLGLAQALGIGPFVRVFQPDYLPEFGERGR